jgi:hypothetical protein
MPNREERYQTGLEFREALQAFARRTKRSLRREKVAHFLQSLYAKELEIHQDEPTQIISDETALIPKAPRSTEEEGTTLLPEEAGDNTEKEILVKRDDDGTVYLVPGTFQIEAMKVWLSLKTLLQLPQAKLKLVAGVLGVLAVMIFLVSKPKDVSPPQKSVASQEIQKKLPMPPEVVPEVSGSEVLAVSTPETMSQALPETKATLPVKEPKPLPAAAEATKKADPEESGTGYLSVQAIPWGYASIDGSGKRETPVRKISIKAGRHNVRVISGSDGASISSTIRLKADQSVVCVADFREEKTIRCGP